MKRNINNYELSNSITEVKRSRFNKTYVENILKCNENHLDRQKVAKELLQYLCGLYKIATPYLNVYNIPQPHTTNQRGTLKSKTYGNYVFFTSNTKNSPCSINIWNLTAKREQVISINCFLDTLLHEFMHHYDKCVLNIDSKHTSGFYKRIGDLKNKLTK